MNEFVVADEVLEVLLGRGGGGHFLLLDIGCCAAVARVARTFQRVRAGGSKKVSGALSEQIDGLRRGRSIWPARDAIAMVPR